MFWDVLDGFSRRVLSRYEQEIPWLKRHSIATASLVEEVLRTSRLAFFCNGGGGLERAIVYGALLHDIGKLLLPTSIVLSSDKYGPGSFERRILEEHPLKGYIAMEWLPDTPPWSVVRQIVLMHHERMDGKGYPSFLKDIPLYVQVVAAADVVTAVLAKDRPYHSGFSVEEAKGILAAEALDDRVKAEVWAVLEKKAKVDFQDVSSLLPDSLHGSLSY